MVYFEENLSKSFELYKKKITFSLLFGGLFFILFLLGTMSYGILFVFLYPLLLSWFYKKLDFKVKNKYFNSILSSFVPFVSFFLGIDFISLYIYSQYLNGLIVAGNISYYNQFSNPEYLYIGIISLIISFLSFMILSYSFYSSIFDKEDKFNIDFKKSFKLFLYNLLIGDILIQIALFAIIVLVIFLSPLMILYYYQIENGLSILWMIVLFLFIVPYSQIFIANEFLDM